MYGVEKRILSPASEVQADDLVTQTEAQDILGVTQQAVLNRVNGGSFTVVWHVARDHARAGSARLLLRSEVEAAAAGDRRPGGGSYRVAPEVLDRLPELNGAVYGFERRVVEPAPELTVEDLVSQREAAALLGVSKSTLVGALARGAFTVVWDLERNGSGARSARLLLRAEVEAAAAGERRMSRASYRMPPLP